MSFDADDLAVIPEKVTKLNAFVFALKDKSRWLYDGKALARLIPALPQNAVISPDGKKAVYEGDGDLYLVKLPSMETTRLTRTAAPTGATAYAIRALRAISPTALPGSSAPPA